MTRYMVDVDYEAQGTVSVEVQAKDVAEAQMKARKRARAELMSTSVLGPRHIPMSVELHVSQVEPA